MRQEELLLIFSKIIMKVRTEMFYVHGKKWNASHIVGITIFEAINYTCRCFKHLIRVEKKISVI